LTLMIDFETYKSVEVVTFPILRLRFDFNSPEACTVDRGMFACRKLSLFFCLGQNREKFLHAKIKGLAYGSVGLYLNLTGHSRVGNLG
jgi:hypothetical protein